MKTWQQPKLIILTRGKSGERVLTVCKTEDGDSLSPVVNYTMCDNNLCTDHCNEMDNS